jgi:mono/diheme cytochrome c family protein
MAFKRAVSAAAWMCAAILVLGCSETSSPKTQPPSAAPAPKPADADSLERGPADLVAEGRKTYLGNCIACHNPDPKLDGPLGPAVAGAEEPLLEARILNAQYPEGYTPKRDTRTMVPMPFLKPRIPAIAAYLASEG